ncbi:MAG: hypothetical protein PHN56_01225 [Candidatus Nanoarchaeia archaeon]|nr:hypothetical protein [Candidatus Nanoarchaeia archaeon]
MSNAFDKYLLTLSDKEVDEQFLIEYNRCIKSNFRTSYHEPLDSDDLQRLYNHLLKNHSQGFSESTNTIYVYPKTNKSFLAQNRFLNKVYLENNNIIIESNDHNLCSEVIEFLNKNEKFCKLKFIELNSNGKKTGFIEELL